MENLEGIRQKLQRHKKYLIEKYHLKSMGIFGSFSRNEQTENSDIDILVAFDQPIGIEFIDLAEELEVILNHKVDLISRKALKPGYLEVIHQEIAGVWN